MSVLTGTPAETAISTSSVVVREPLAVSTRYMPADSGWTEVTSDNARSFCSQSAGGLSNWTSITFDPGTLALSASGVSSATSFPWSTIAIRLQSRSASSM